MTESARLRKLHAAVSPPPPPADIAWFTLRALSYANPRIRTACTSHPGTVTLLLLVLAGKASSGLFVLSTPEASYTIRPWPPCLSHWLVTDHC